MLGIIDDLFLKLLRARQTNLFVIRRFGLYLQHNHQVVVKGEAHVGANVRVHHAVAVQHLQLHGDG